MLQQRCPNLGSTHVGHTRPVTTVEWRPCDREEYSHNQLETEKECSNRAAPIRGTPPLQSHCCAMEIPFKTSCQSSDEMLTITLTTKEASSKLTSPNDDTSTQGHCASTAQPDTVSFAAIVPSPTRRRFAVPPASTLRPSTSFSCPPRISKVSYVCYPSM